MNSESNSTTTCSDLEVMDVITQNSQAVTHWTSEFSQRIYQAIEDNKLEDIKLFFEDKILLDAPLQITGPLAGYTALHTACIKNNKELVKLLVENYHANVNVVADDGSQPIHLACLFGNVEAVCTFIAAGANIDAEIERNLFLKYATDKFWCNDFGDKMTILTFTILYDDDYHLGAELIKHRANLRIKSLENKTLMMYAIEKNKFSVGKRMVKMIRRTGDKKLINARDNDGFSVSHYFMHPKKFENGQDWKNWRKESQMGKIMSLLISAGADIYATVNGNPDTMLLNMAASKICFGILEAILPYYEHIKDSKALYYATLPLDPQTLFGENPTADEQDQLELLQQLRENNIKLIIKDLVNRTTFGLPVPEEEKLLLLQLVATDLSIQNFVYGYGQGFITGKLGQVVVEDGNEYITYDDVIKLCLNDRKLRGILKHKTIIEGFLNLFPDEYDYLFFSNQISMRIRRVRRRVELANKLKKVKQLTTTLPFPYELILEIIQYLNNRDLKKFVNAFIL